MLFAWFFWFIRWSLTILRIPKKGLMSLFDSFLNLIKAEFGQCDFGNGFLFELYVFLCVVTPEEQVCGVVWNFHSLKKLRTHLSNLADPFQKLGWLEELLLLWAAFGAWVIGYLHYPVGVVLRKLLEVGLVDGRDLPFARKEMEMQQDQHGQVECSCHDVYTF